MKDTRGVNAQKKQYRKRFSAYIKAVQPPQIKRNDLLKLRDNAVIARYYYYTEIKRLRHDDALTIIAEEEFFKGLRTIENVLLRNDQYFCEVLKNSPSIQQLKKQYPTFIW